MRLLSTLSVASACTLAAAQPPPELRLGRANHAFDHLGAIGQQAEAAAASGANVLYASGLGALGYEGLPADADLATHREAASQYVRSAKAQGISLVIGYVCATSIVGLDAFHKHWSADLRAQFATPPHEWLQVDPQGQPLPSWYGGAYRPACMNNPDWRTYERHMVRQQLETGHDGVFFDNPTVHPQGCYCGHCMKSFAAFLNREGVALPSPAGSNSSAVAALRQLAIERPQDFLRFRSTVARDFLADMRAFARTISPTALITCNNSLNSPAVLFTQCRDYGYNIYELSKAEDFVVVEDMGSQPRAEPGGQTFEYGPTYHQLHAISHGKPIVAVTLAAADYHTPPNLVRLAMAEAAAHQASYLSWPTWPADQRQRMIAAIRPQADLLRRCEGLLNDAQFRADVLVFMPFRRWVETDQCAASPLTAALSRANLQYKVVCEDDLTQALKERSSSPQPVLLVESLAALTPAEDAAAAEFQKQGGHVVAADNADWLPSLQAAVGAPSVTVKAPPTVRAVVTDQPSRTIVHIYNLNVERVSSFEDKLTPAVDLAVSVSVPFSKVASVTVHAADHQPTSRPTEFTTQPQPTGARVQFALSRLEISAIVSIELSP